MELDLELGGRRVLIIGERTGARRTEARLRAAGALIEHLETCLLREIAACASRETPPELVVWVGEEDESASNAAEEARKAGILFVREEPVEATPCGDVTLVGAGPGRFDLMTLAGFRALAAADVVLYDRLAPRAELGRWAPGAELIDVGKTPGHHAVPQPEIEALLVEHARRGLRVVRLKGGDSFVFGRGAEEVAACAAAGIPVTVVPGVTSAIAVPASVGIPVTHREVSRSFTVLSGHVPFRDDELAHLVGLGGTLVVLMGVNTLFQLVAGLRRNGMPPNMPLAVVERGFTADQRTTVTTIGEASGVLGSVMPRSPAVIVIGEVVRRGAWYDQGAEWESVMATASAVHAT